jgi:hypothetical protein
MKLFILSLIVIVSAQVGRCQSNFVGTFSNFTTHLTLRADSTFSLSTFDPVYVYTYKQYQNDGKWTTRDGKVILNPEKEKRVPKVTLTEGSSDLTDSIEIKINYATELHESENYVGTEPATVELMTVMINGHKKFINLVHKKQVRNCSFAPKIKHQRVVDSLVTFRIPKQQIKTLAIYTYGFEKPLYLQTMAAGSNLFEIDVVQPLDTERMPRSKTVIVTKNQAFYYERRGHVVTSTWLGSPLKRVSN